MQRYGWLIIGWLVASGAGCAARGNLPLLQQELRAQEARVRELQQQLSQSQFQLEACRRENEALREQFESTTGRKGLLPEQAALLFSLREITLHGLLTGGINKDAFPGDDALLVLVQPRDQKGDVLKAPGSITIELFDMALEEPRRRIGFWQFNAQQTLELWTSGLLASGYRFELPWQYGYPRHADLSLHVRFQTPDGRVFPKTQQLRVQLLPGQTPPATDASAPPAEPAPSASLPPPPERTARLDRAPTEPGPALASPASRDVRQLETADERR